MSDKVGKGNGKPFYDRYENYKAEIESKQFTALFNHFLGKMLTFIDASVSDKEQREAQKQIIKQMIWEDYEPLQKWLFWKQFEDKDNTPLNVFPF